MKFRNHAIIALAICVAANAPIPALFGVSAGSIYPDKMDRFIAGESEKAFLKVHRRFSHWPWTYIGVFVSMLFWPGVIQTIWGQFVMGFASGAALHVLGDMLTVGGTPYLPWSLKKKFAFKLFKTGSWKEYAYTYATVALCGAYLVGDFYLTGKLPLFHYQQTIDQAVSILAKSGTWLIERI